MMSMGYRCKAKCPNMVATLFPHITLWGKKNPPLLITWLFIVCSLSQLPHRGKPNTLTTTAGSPSGCCVHVYPAQHREARCGDTWVLLTLCQYMHYKHPSSPPTSLTHPLYILTTTFLLETSIPPTSHIPRTPRCLHQPPGS